MHLVTTAIQANTFTSNIRAYVSAATPAIICRTYGSETFPAISAQAATGFDAMLATIDTLGGPKQLTKSADGIFDGHGKPIF
jgi:hypothetical protein